MDYKIPCYLVDKCTVVKAIAIDGEGHKGKIVTANYFVDYSERKGFDNVYYVCIDSNPDNFFGYDNGIFVLGKAFDEYVKSEQWKIDKIERLDSWENWSGNYSLENEVKCNVQIFNDNEEIILSDKGVISVKGDTSVSFYQKSMNVTCDGII